MNSKSESKSPPHFFPRSSENRSASVQKDGAPGSHKLPTGLMKYVDGPKNRAYDLATNPSVSLLHPSEWKAMLWVGDLADGMNRVS